MIDRREIIGIAGTKSLLPQHRRAHRLHAKFTGNTMNGSAQLFPWMRL